MHLVYPPKFCITVVSNFSWVLQSSQEKSKTMVMQHLGVNKVHYGLCENGEVTNLIKYLQSMINVGVMYS